MLRQNFLNNLLNLSKSSRFFLLLLVGTFFNVEYIESTPKKLLQQQVNNVLPPAPQATSAYQSTDNVPTVMRNYVLQGMILINNNDDDDDEVVEEWYEDLPDGKSHFLVKKYLDGHTKKCGPNPNE